MTPGAIAFLALWVLLGATFAFVAMRGGPAGAREALHIQSRRAGRVASVVFLVTYVAFGLAVPTLVLAGNNGKTSPTGEKLTNDQEHGRVLFGRSCNECHTLKAANTVGIVGPDLDQRIGGITGYKPRVAFVLDAVNNGRARGNGRMPKGLLLGRDARDVAEFVAAVAGR